MCEGLMVKDCYYIRCAGHRNGRSDLCNSIILVNDKKETVRCASCHSFYDIHKSAGLLHVQKRDKATINFKPLPFVVD
jgi:hypothetical protein